MSFKDAWELSKVEILLEGRKKKLETLKNKHNKLMQDVASLEEEIHVTSQIEEKRKAYDAVKAQMDRLKEEIKQLEENGLKSADVDVDSPDSAPDTKDKTDQAGVGEKGTRDVGDAIEKTFTNFKDIAFGQDKTIEEDKKDDLKKIKGMRRKQEIEDRRKHGDKISRNAAGSMEKSKKEKKKDRRRQGKKDIKDMLKESWTSYTFKSQLQEADPAARDIIMQQIANTDDPEEKAELEAMLAQLGEPKKEVVPAKPYQAEEPRFNKSEDHLTLKDIRAKLNPELQKLTRLKRDLAGWKKRMSTLATDDQKAEIENKMDELRNNIGHQTEVVEELQTEIQRVKDQMRG